MATPATSMPCTSAAVWKSFIQRPSIVLLQNLIYQFQTIHHQETARLLPKMNVFKECIHADLRVKAATLLGIEFESETKPHSKTRISPFVTMTVLQLSVLSQYAGLPADAGEREAAVEMLLKVFTPEDLNGNPFADGNNVMHLAAFLQLKLTLDLLVAHGGDPWLKNGRGLTAYDILLAVKDEHFASAIYFQKNKGSLRPVQAIGNTTPSATLTQQETRKAATAQEVYSTATTMHQGNGSLSTHRGVPASIWQNETVHEGGSIQLDMNDGPQVFRLTFDQDNGAGTSLQTETRPRCYIPRRFDAALEGFEEVEEENDDSIRLVEQDAIDMDQRRQSFYHHQHHQQYHYNHSSSDDSDAESDIALYQDQTCYRRMRSRRYGTKGPTPLYSILKRPAGWPPQDMSPEQKHAYQAYQAYVATLKLQPKRKDNGHSDGVMAESKKRVRWQTVKKVRIFRRHLYHQSDDDSQDEGPAVSEQFEEPVEDHSLASFDSPYDSVRPMTPTAHCSSPVPMFDHMDATTISDPLPSASYTRPLPELPQQKEATKSLLEGRKSISRAMTPPPLALVQDVSEKPAKARGIPGLWSPRKLSSSPYAVPRFSMSESRLGSLAKATFKRIESQDDEPGREDKTVSTTRSRSALAILDSPQWFCKAFAETISPLSSLSRATGKDLLKIRPPIPSSSNTLDDHASHSDDDQDGFRGSWSAGSRRSSLALSALLSPVYDATFKLSGKAREAPVEEDHSEHSALTNIRSSLRHKFSTLPSRSLSPLQLAFSKIPSRSAPSSPVANSAASNSTSSSNLPLDASGYLKEVIRGRTPLPVRGPQPFISGEGVHKALVDGQELPQSHIATSRSSNASEPAVLCRKSSSSTSRHAYWKKRKEVMVVIPPRATITSGTISMDGILLGSNDPCPPRSITEGSGSKGMKSFIAKNEDSVSAECLAPVPKAAKATDPGALHTFFPIHDQEDRGCKVATSHLEQNGAVKETDRAYSIWKDASDVLVQPRRATLSSCESPSSTQTGVLYLRLQRACGFSLPIPTERTMISIRIDTGHEKVDTDYVPLDRIDILFNQEFCLPVTPSLAITITLHLMQAPHLQPRYLAMRSPSPLPLPSSTQPEAPFFAKDLQHMDTPQVMLDGSMSSRASLFSSVRTKKSLLLPLLFKKRSLQSHSDCSVSTTVSVPSSDSVSTTTDTAYGSDSDGQPSSCSTIGRSAGQCLVSRPDEAAGFTRSGLPPLHSGPPSTNQAEFEMQKARSTFSKWRNGIMSVHKRRKNPNTTTMQYPQRCKGITLEEVESTHPFQLQYRQQEQQQQQQQQQQSAFVGLGSRFTASDATMLHASDFNDYLPPPPAWISSPSSTSSSCAVPTLPQLTLSEIQESETPLQVLSRHILFDDELCLARSGIMFRDLRRSCENQIVGVEFETINNGVDLNDYSQMSSSNNSTTYGGHAVTQGGTRRKALYDHEHGHEDRFSDEDEEDEDEDGVDSRCVVAKIMTSMCFVPGPEMDPEDAIYDDESRLPLEPQNLVECQQGLYYFQWRDQVRFQARLFYLTARGHWRDAWFCIVGSKLWQCLGPICAQSGPLEKVRCLELEDLEQIESNRGILKVGVPDCGEEEEVEEEGRRQEYHHHHHHHHQGDHPLQNNGASGDGLEEDEPFYAPRNGFRLRLRVARKDGSGVEMVRQTTVTQDFYAESPEMAQAWISAVMDASRAIPARPYWMREPI
ncbi:hypothetical protein BGZ72_008173 [Mortierella alpina]|nr:hypothetical protein BGZ72_008173 [Mortierella alpina]